MTNPSEAATAVIAVGSAVAGGVVAGIFTRWGLAVQWRHDRADRERERSHEAARRVLEAVGTLDHALVTWQAKPATGDAVRVAFNDFAFALSIASAELRDDDLRNRLEQHMLLSGKAWDHLSGFAGFPQPEQELLAAWRAHDLAMNRALTAHLRGAALPAYRGPSEVSSAALLEWGPTAEQPR